MNHLAAIYLGSSTVMLAIAAFFWNNKSLPNLIIKFMMSFMTVFGIYLIVRI